MEPRMNRRELLQRAALLTGSAIAVPGVLSVLEGCSDKQSAGGQSLAFSAEQRATIEEIAEIMIPRTSTPGAKDVGVPAFIEAVLRDVYPDDDQHDFLNGLQEFETQARRAHGKAFMQLEPAVRVALVQKIHDSAVAAEKAQQEKRAAPTGAVQPASANRPSFMRAVKGRVKALLGRKQRLWSYRPFILTMKELSLLGFFTSQAGATQVLQYLPVPGSFRPCVPLQEAGNGKTWALETGYRF
jgi:gluconate 2-dehydrogenase gamma chain